MCRFVFSILKDGHVVLCFGAALHFTYSGLPDDDAVSVLDPGPEVCEMRQHNGARLSWARFTKNFSACCVKTHTHTKEYARISMRGTNNEKKNF